MTEDEHAKVVPVNGNNHSENNQHRAKDDDSESAEVRHKRSVRFGDGDQLITAVFEANSPWANEPLNPYELAGAYKLRCDVEGIVPLYSVLSQLESINLRYSYARRDVFTLKGTQLKAPHIELLEEVFKRVQFELINLENTNLTDETMSALCEMFEFYESCAELCLARNPQITGEGWKAVARLLRKLPCLRWLDVRGIPLNESDTQSLSHAIRSQAMCCRAEMSKFSKYQLANQRLAESVLTAGLTDEEQRTQVNKLACEMKRLATCQTHAAIKCQQCLSQIPYRGLRGLHLGSTKVRDIALSRLVTGVRLSSICDLRLPDNQLTPSDAVFLIPLLRFGATLRYLDLSRNRLGDEGCRVIANALSSTAYATQPPAASTPGLRRLYLGDNQLTEASMHALARALSHCTLLNCLQLNSNPEIGCSGVVSLQPGILHSRQLKRLGLARCGLSCIGAVALAEVMVDRPRRLSRLDLRENEIGAAGLLALGRCLKCVDRRVQIDGLDHINPSPSIPSSPHSAKQPVGLLHTVARLAGSPPAAYSPSEKDPQEAIDQVSTQAAQTYMQMMAENHVNFPNNNQSARCWSISTRYHRIQVPNASATLSTPVTEDLDCRYLWGDSSDEDDDGDGGGGGDGYNTGDMSGSVDAVLEAPSEPESRVKPTESNGSTDEKVSDSDRIVRLSDLGVNHSSSKEAVNGTNSLDRLVTNDHAANEQPDLQSMDSVLMMPFSSPSPKANEVNVEPWDSHNWNKTPINTTDKLTDVPPT